MPRFRYAQRGRCHRNMVSLLLDFPWSFEVILDFDPAPLVLARDFMELIGQLPWKPAPFVDPEEAALFMEKLNNQGGRPLRKGRWVADAFRFLHIVGCGDLGAHRAIPVDGPAEIRSKWQRALRDQIGDGQNWRNPQIVISTDRAERWRACVHNHEVRIALEDLPDSTIERVVIFMPLYGASDQREYGRDYRAQKYAMADLDPWDVRHIHYPHGGGNHYAQCRLPRPGSLLDVPLDRLVAELNELRTNIWSDQGRYWYIPPIGWQYNTIDKPTWRRGAFPERATQNPKRMGKRGPVDYRNQIWLWDMEEGHWDVQLEDGTHLRINHEGVCLG